MALSQVHVFYLFYVAKNQYFTTHLSSCEYIFISNSSIHVEYYRVSNVFSHKKCMHSCL